VGILTKEQIKAVDDLRSRIVSVDVPEWGGSVNIRPMDVRELDEYSNDAMRSKASGLKDFRTRLVAYCLCDENGNRLFTEKDIDALAGKSGTVMDRLYRACDELNDIGTKMNDMQAQIDAEQNMKRDWTQVQRKNIQSARSHSEKLASLQV
jgi:hypothetical protein